MMMMMKQKRRKRRRKKDEGKRNTRINSSIFFLIRSFFCGLFCAKASTDNFSFSSSFSILTYDDDDDLIVDIITAVQKYVSKSASEKSGRSLRLIVFMNS